MSKGLKVIILFLFIFICHSLFSAKAESVAVITSEPLYRAMQATGAEVKTLTMQTYLPLSLQKNEMSDLTEIMEMLADDFGLTAEAIDKEIIQNSKERSLNIKGLANGQQISITLKSLLSEAVDHKVHLSIKIIENYPDAYSSSKTQEKLTKILKKFLGQPQITTCLEGYLDGKLRKGMTDCCIRDAFDSVGAEENSRMDGEGYISVTGYTPLIANQIMANRVPVNMNMAIRYHSIDHRTYITIGSPIILVEY